MPAELPTIEEHLGRTRSLGGDLAKLQGDDLEASPRLQAQLEEGAVKVGKHHGACAHQAVRCSGGNSRQIECGNWYQIGGRQGWQVSKVIKNSRLNCTQ